jgi:sulfur-oxidizing protein SoxY
MTTVSQSTHRARRPVWIRVWIGLCLLAPIIVLAPLAEAETTDANAQRWAEIRTALFADRPIEDGAALLQLDAPYRAEDAAVVPIALRSLLDPSQGRPIRSLWLIVDMNPVPVAASIRFPGAAHWTQLATRIRVNAYTQVRAIAETDEGTLYMVERFVKASGGCSAPSLKDPAAAAAQLGRTKLVLPQRARAGAPLVAQFMIKHPNSSGLQFDQIARQFIAADYVKRIQASYRGQVLFIAETGISISEDPSLRFDLIPDGPGELTVQVTDSKGRSFEQRASVALDGD